MFNRLRTARIRRRQAQQPGVYIGSGTPPDFTLDAAATVTIWGPRRAKTQGQTR